MGSSDLGGAQLRTVLHAEVRSNTEALSLFEDRSIHYSAESSTIEFLESRASLRTGELLCSSTEEFPACHTSDCKAECELDIRWLPVDPLEYHPWDRPCGHPALCLSILESGKAFYGLRCCLLEACAHVFYKFLNWHVKPAWNRMEK